MGTEYFSCSQGIPKLCSRVNAFGVHTSIGEMATAHPAMTFKFGATSAAQRAVHWSAVILVPTVYKFSFLIFMPVASIINFHESEPAR